MKLFFRLLRESKQGFSRSTSNALLPPPPPNSTVFLKKIKVGGDVKNSVRCIFGLKTALRAEKLVGEVV